VQFRVVERDCAGEHEQVSAFDKIQYVPDMHSTAAYKSAFDWDL